MLGGGTAAAAVASCKPKIASIASDEQQSGDVPKDKMTYRKTLSKGDEVSILGYGCMRWPLLKTPDPDGNPVDQEGTNELVDYAIEHGVNYFDTAPMYMRGWSERVMGKALSRHPRDKYFIATKLSNFNTSSWSYEASHKIYKTSFESLQVDYIDYYLLHNIGKESVVDGVHVDGLQSCKDRFVNNGMLDFLVKERAAGRIRNLGFSFHGDIRAYDYLLSLHDEVKWDFVLIQVNYKDWNYADETSKNNIDGVYLYGELEKRGINAVIMEPLLGGRLAKLPEYLANKLRSERPNESIASWAFRYAASHKNVFCVLSGMAYLEHLQDNIRTFSPLDSISESENDLLMDVAKLMIEYPIIECTTCQYCMPCPYGIDIPSTFSHYNTCVCEGLYPQSTQDDNYKEARSAFLMGYDRAVPKLRQADHWIGCGECISHCPQKIKIPQEMRRVSAYIEALKQGNLDEVNRDEALMVKISEQLKGDGVSCVIANGDDVRSFKERGVADLYKLMQSEPEFLKGALVADKIVGKGAAAIMIHCGVKRLYTTLISQGAEELIFREGRMVVNASKSVPFIENRDKSGWCPIEKLCKNETKVAAIVPLITKFVKEMESGGCEFD